MNEDEGRVQISRTFFEEKQDIAYIVLFTYICITKNNNLFV